MNQPKIPVSENDEQALIDAANELLADMMCARVLLSAMPEAILRFYEQNAAKIAGEVLTVRGFENGEGYASYRRSVTSKGLFVFSDNYIFVPDVFTSCCKSFELPKDLVQRVVSQNPIPATVGAD